MSAGTTVASGMILIGWPSRFALAICVLWQAEKRISPPTCDALALAGVVFDRILAVGEREVHPLRIVLAHLDRDAMARRLLGQRADFGAPASAATASAGACRTTIQISSSTDMFECLLPAATTRGTANAPDHRSADRSARGHYRLHQTIIDITQGRPFGLKIKNSGLGICGFLLLLGRLKGLGRIFGGLAIKRAKIVL